MKEREIVDLLSVQSSEIIVFDEDLEFGPVYRLAREQATDVSIDVDVGLLHAMFEGGVLDTVALSYGISYRLSSDYVLALGSY